MVALGSPAGLSRLHCSLALGVEHVPVGQCLFIDFSDFFKSGGFCVVTVGEDVAAVEVFGVHFRPGVCNRIVQYSISRDC